MFAFQWGARGQGGRQLGDVANTLIDAQLGAFCRNRPAPYQLDIFLQGGYTKNIPMWKYFSMPRKAKVRLSPFAHYL
jgi:hypothetical protein